MASETIKAVTDAEAEILPSDILIIIRDGCILLRGPDHETGDRVGEEFITALGVAAAWEHPDFHLLMQHVVHEGVKSGEFEDILSAERVQ